MTRAGAMNLLSSRLRRIMPDKKELSIVTFSSETVVFDGKGDRVVACPTEQEAVEYIRGQEIPVDRQGSDFGVPEDENDHKLHGIRPVVIVSNDSANRHSTVFHAVPLTSKIHKKTYLPTHIFISSFKAVGLRTNSIAQCEQLCDVKDTDLIEKIGKVSKNQLRQITKGMQIQLGMSTKHNNPIA